MTGESGWLVLLIGGHSGAGKSTLAAEVARRVGAAWTEVDDVRMALQRVTTPEQAPAGDTQATMHWRYGQWLRGETERLGQPVVEPRPYETLVERVMEVVGPAGPAGSAQLP